MHEFLHSHTLITVEKTSVKAAYANKKVLRSYQENYFCAQIKNR